MCNFINDTGVIEVVRKGFTLCISLLWVHRDHSLFRQVLRRLGLRVTSTTRLTTDIELPGGETITYLHNRQQGVTLSPITFLSIKEPSHAL